MKLPWFSVHPQRNVSLPALTLFEDTCFSLWDTADASEILQKTPVDMKGTYPIPGKSICCVFISRRYGSITTHQLWKHNNILYKWHIFTPKRIDLNPFSGRQQADVFLPFQPSIDLHPVFDGQKRHSLSWFKVRWCVFTCSWRFPPGMQLLKEDMRRGWAWADVAFVLKGGWIKKCWK